MPGTRERLRFAAADEGSSTRSNGALSVMSSTRSGRSAASTVALRSFRPADSDIQMLEEKLPFRVTVATSTVTTASQSQPRFVAGHAFFNYHLHGSLRPGGAGDLISAHYCGLR